MDVKENGVTIKQVADECGVSKSTAVRKFKELGLSASIKDGKGTVFLGPESASQLAHALTIGRKFEPEVQVETLNPLESLPVITPTEPVSNVNDELIASYRDQIKTLKAMNDSLQQQIDQLTTTIESMRNDRESTIAILNDQIDRLDTQIATIQSEKEHLRDELAMSRALEGFHFPWQRERIMTRFLLPAKTENATVEPNYEMP